MATSLSANEMAQLRTILAQNSKSMEASVEGIGEE